MNKYIYIYIFNTMYIYIYIHIFVCASLCVYTSSIYKYAHTNIHEHIQVYTRAQTCMCEGFRVKGLGPGILDVEPGLGVWPMEPLPPP